MLNDDIMGYMLDGAIKGRNLKPKTPPVKAEITPDEALQIFNESIELFQRHNVSYQCACRLAISLAHAFITGAVELYKMDMNKP